MKTLLACFAFAVAPLAWAGPHLDKAQELYKKGPAAAEEIIAELNLELKDDPRSDTALLMLAITQRGVGKLDDSLATLERLEKLNDANKKLNPDVYFLRVENFFFKKDYKKAKELLAAYWGIFQTSDRLKMKSKALTEAVEKALAAEKKPEEAAPSAPPPGRP